MFCLEIVFIFFSIIGTFAIVDRTQEVHQIFVDASPTGTTNPQVTIATTNQQPMVTNKYPESDHSREEQFFVPDFSSDHFTLDTVNGDLSVLVLGGLFGIEKTRSKKMIKLGSLELEARVAQSLVPTTAASDDSKFLHEVFIKKDETNYTSPKQVEDLDHKETIEPLALEVHNCNVVASAETCFKPSEIKSNDPRDPQFGKFIFRTGLLDINSDVNTTSVDIAAGLLGTSYSKGDFQFSFGSLVFEIKKP